jgi:hypothetical protein
VLTTTAENSTRRRDDGDFGETLPRTLNYMFLLRDERILNTSGVTTQGAGVKGGKSKTVHELQKTEAGRAELARRQAEKERVSNLNF